jgi:hypothetical protein
VIDIISRDEGAASFKVSRINVVSSLAFSRRASPPDLPFMVFLISLRRCDLAFQFGNTPPCRIETVEASACRRCNSINSDACRRMAIAIVFARSMLELLCRICNRPIDSPLPVPCLFKSVMRSATEFRELLVRQICAVSFLRCVANAARLRSRTNRNLYNL